MISFIDRFPNASQWLENQLIPMQARHWLINAADETELRHQFDPKMKRNEKFVTYQLNGNRKATKNLSDSCRIHSRYQQLPQFI